MKMRTYRVYKLNPAGRIIAGDWLQAPSESAARIKAETLCEPGAAEIEVWEGSRRVASFECDENGRPKPR